MFTKSHGRTKFLIVFFNSFENCCLLKFQTLICGSFDISLNKSFYFLYFHAQLVYFGIKY